MKYLSFFLCLKYLRSKKIVFLSVAAVAMSCALLIVTSSLFTGFINAVENGAGEHMGDIVLTAPSGLRIPEYDGLIKKLVDDSLIDGATGVLRSQGLLLLGQGDVRAVRIWGIELPGRNSVSPVDEFLIDRPAEGTVANFVSADGVADAGGFVGIGVLGRPDERTDEYDIEQIRSNYIGEPAMLTTGTVLDRGKLEGVEETDSGSRGARFKRRTVRFEITNVVYSGMYEFDKNFVYLPIGALGEKLYPGAGNVADMIQIRLAAGADIDEGLGTVKDIWRSFAKGKFEWAYLADIESSKQMQAMLIGEYKKQLGMLMLIFGVVSGGVVLLIFCIFYLIVMTKQKDIAIVKSCGLGSGGVAMMFLAFGLVVGAVGSA